MKLIDLTLTFLQFLQIYYVIQKKFSYPYSIFGILFQHFYIIFTPYFERKLYITKSLQTLFNRK